MGLPYLTCVYFYSRLGMTSTVSSWGRLRLSLLERSDACPLERVTSKPRHPRRGLGHGGEGSVGRVTVNRDGQRP